MKLSEVKPGRIILVERKFYDHYAIYAGNAQVIHYAPKRNGGTELIHRAELDEFLDGADRFYVPNIPQNRADLQALINYHKQRRGLIQSLVDEIFNSYNQMVEKVYTESEALKRAMGRVGEALYNVMGNNCQHFAFWCKFKLRISSQIGRLVDFFNDLMTRNICQRFHNCVVC